MISDTTIVKKIHAFLIIINIMISSILLCVHGVIKKQIWYKPMNEVAIHKSVFLQIHSEI